ncbi:hypothetical protein J2Z53_002377 [Clostridium moniliforme]|uniref:Uncharacterized protein n=1 Tax=Clostridium moniliforme TaxID=39489 RepID=A0ABS4F3F6_9CLOT|nr:hypothetical protein [Clostridium moniliforme]MBP1890763.1 hypothetical protein [Clostridium moniliforme]
MAKKIEEEIIKSTRYCNLIKQASLKDEDYTYYIEKIFADHHYKKRYFHILNSLLTVYLKYG